MTGKCLKVSDYIYIQGSMVEGDEDRECIAVYSDRNKHKLTDSYLVGHIILNEDFEYVFTQANRERDTFLYAETLYIIYKIMKNLTDGNIKYDQKTREFELKEVI